MPLIQKNKGGNSNTDISVLKALANYINVKDYTVGDGVTDDTSGLITAHQAAVNSKKMLYFSNGIYRITADFVISVPIVCDRATIKGDSNTISKVVSVNSSNISIKNLIVDGNNKANCGIFVNPNLKNITIQGCEVKNITQPIGNNNQATGIRLAGGVNNIQISENYVHHISAPVSGIARGILVSKSAQIEGDSTDIVISKNTVEEISPVADGDGIVIQDIWVNSDNTFKLGQSQVRIINNNLNRCFKRGIKVQSPGVLVQGNQIKMPDEIVSYSGISVYAPKTKIINNTIYAVGMNNGMDIDGTASTIALDDITIDGNSVTMAINNNTTDLIRIYGNISMKIINNVLNNGRYGIRLTNKGSGSLISNNTLKSCNAPAISVEGSSGVFPQDVIISTNIYIQCNHYGLDVLGGTNIIEISNTGFADYGLISENSPSHIIRNI